MPTDLQVFEELRALSMGQKKSIHDDVIEQLGKYAEIEKANGGLNEPEKILCAIPVAKIAFLGSELCIQYLHALRQMGRADSIEIAKEQLLETKDELCKRK